MKLAIPYVIILPAIILFFTGCDKPKDGGKTDLEVLKDTTVEKTLTNFLFVSKWYGKIGVYNYDLLGKKYETVWWNPRENVTFLVSEPGEHPAFFLTTGRMGTKGNFPFFERVKIYRISSDLSATENIYKIESGMQINSHWNQDGNFEVVFTAIDKTDPTYINKHRKVFDYYGKLIDDEIESFNLTVDGFPELLPRRNPTVSPSGSYGISIIGDSIFLKSVNVDSLFFITVVKHKQNKVSWSNDEKFLFFSTLDLNDETVKKKNPETSELFIYSIYSDSIVASWSGGGVKNFFAVDSLIVFDDGFGKNSSINVYNFVRSELIDKLGMKGECGLYYLPGI